MPRWRLPSGFPRLRHLLAALLILVVLGGFAAFLVAWSGLYSVAASRGHWAITNWFLHFTLRNSVETHSLGIRAANLDDPALIRLGAGHFASGCAACHGAPGEPSSVVFQHMLPKAPDLAHAAHQWKADELFWIVRNGFKFTGMPAWPAQDRTDEVWAMVAFLQALPSLTPEQYRALAGINATHSNPLLAGCAACHGDAGDYPRSALVPVLHGMQQAYLERALREYRAGQRQSGVMQHPASTLKDTEITALARHYAALPVRPAAPPVASERLARGRDIAERGLPEAGVPACLSCHERPGSHLFPRLSGQHARYVTGQLALWRNGSRRLSAPGQIMAVIASRLPAEAAEDVAGYFESRDPAGPSQ